MDSRFKTRSAFITCEQCKYRQLIDVPFVIDVVGEPQDKEDLLSGKLHTFVCAKCKYAKMVDFTLTYIDAKRRLIVLVEDHKGAVNLKDLPPVRGKTTQLRIVSTRHELIEKVLIRDAKLDDRIVEYLKIEARYASLRRSMPIDGSLMFSGLVKNDEGKSVVQFQDFAGTDDDMFLSFPLGYYRSAAKKLKPFVERMPMLDTRWLRVDGAYGNQLDRMVEKADGKAPRKKRSR